MPLLLTEADVQAILTMPLALEAVEDSFRRLADGAAVRELADIVSGKVPGRTNRDQITLFKSNGIAIEDIVVAGRIYERARERGMGREVPMWQKEGSPLEGRSA